MRGNGGDQQGSSAIFVVLVVVFMCGCEARDKDDERAVDPEPMWYSLRGDALRADSVGDAGARSTRCSGPRRVLRDLEQLEDRLSRIDREMRVIERVLGTEMPDVVTELNVRRDQARQLWKDAWEKRELSSAPARVDVARVVIGRLDMESEEVLYALGGSREHEDAPSS